MTRYYFDLKNGITQRDHAGLDCENDTAAIANGQKIADQVASQGIYKDHACHVSIIHEDGHEVMRVQVAGATGQESAPRLKKLS
ncbi:hypothetical protein V1282_002587 [Nitrobacteraceae bacterium AZCC 2146]